MIAPLINFKILKKILGFLESTNQITGFLNPPIRFVDSGIPHASFAHTQQLLTSPDH